MEKQVNYILSEAHLAGNLISPLLVPDVELKYVNPIIRDIFTGGIPKVPLAGRLKHFSSAWEKVTKDQEILSIVEGYKIPLITPPVQIGVPKIPKLSMSQKELIDKEISDMLKKGAIQSVSDHPKGEFLSSLFLVEKKDRGYRPVINLKDLNKHVPYQHFKMEGLNYLKFMLEEGDFMCKLDMKDAYFSIPLLKESRKLIRFLWSANLYEFLCLCFGLGPAPRVFTKLLKVPIAVLRKFNIRIIIYLDDMLILAKSREEALRSRDTVIYLLRNLGFVMNLKKSVMEPVREIEFLGLIVNSLTLTLSLTQERLRESNKNVPEAIQSFGGFRF